MPKVLAFGTFDGLHPGHRHYLDRAAAYGDLTVVAARDETVLAVKGRLPLRPLETRLLALKEAGYRAVPGLEGDKYEILRRERPDVVCLGYDQAAFTGGLDAACRAAGLRTVIIRLGAFHPGVFKSSFLKYMRVLIGTTNPGKAKEFERLSASLGVTTLTLTEAGLKPIDETGETFLENAVDKAKSYAKASGLVTVADDGGLEVDVLGGGPGVHSHRWAGEHATDLKLAMTVIDRLRGVPWSKRTARLKCVVAVAAPSGECVTAEKAIEGRIAEELDAEKIAPGLPYRALLIVDGLDKLYADLTEVEHDRLNQRRKAFLEVLPMMAEMLEKAKA